MSARVLSTIGILALTLSACARSDRSAGLDTVAVARDSAPHESATATAMPITLTSAAFTANGAMPSKYTCEGANISPPLEWSSAPATAKSLALIVDDPDAPDPAKPQRVYVHWVVYNIPPDATGLAENAAKSGMPAGARQGTNDGNKQTYAGPCPPIGRHRYFFKLYALDIELTGLNNPNKAQLEKAMKGHIVGNAELIGTYEKAKK